MSANEESRQNTEKGKRALKALCDMFGEPETHESEKIERTISTLDMFQKIQSGSVA